MEHSQSVIVLNINMPAIMNATTIKFKPAFDASTWSMIALVLACCSWSLFLIPGWIVVAILCFCVAFCLTPFFSFWYEVDGDELVIYQFFMPTRLPIMKIGKFESTKTILSAPATSLTKRLAISFIDRSVLKSNMPVIISPANRQLFINEFEDGSLQAFLRSLNKPRVNLSEAMAFRKKILLRQELDVSTIGKFTLIMEHLLRKPNHLCLRHFSAFQ
jgi:hypothetical protein